MPIIPSIVNWLYAKRIEQIERFRKEASLIQHETLASLLSTASATEWGKKFGYSSITTAREFQSRVPVQSYEDLIPYVERLRKGETDLLWPGEIKWFARSSGTTSARSKYIPMTHEALEDCHYQGGKDVLSLYTMNYPSTRIFSGKALTLGGSHKIDTFGNNSLFGDLSAILIENAPSWIELIRTPKPEIALTEDFEKKVELITRATISENVTNFSGVPSWYLTLIKYILAYTGKKDLLEVWPNLEVFFHGGISFTPYREIYKTLIRSDQMHYMETYNASEGFFGIQDDPGSDDMLLMLDYGIFYEFIPADKLHTDSPRSYTVDEVETGVNYAMVISTNGGLWRYMIGDTLVFTGREPLRFRITGRTRQFINAFGEEVIVDNADRALEAACKATGAIISDYTAGPVFMGASSKGAHEWLVEFEKEPENIPLFTEVLDDSLRDLNSDYDAKRYKDMNLTLPIVRSLPAGTFHKWLKKNNKLGGQNKVPRLSNNRDYVDELLKIITDNNLK